tara:strand:+ start:15621 stop:16004 length:384 start_codon:yes stop_codon:yes gene_type:complete
MAAKRKRKQTLNQFIINKFLNNSKAIWKNKGFVAREMKFTKDLIQKYPLKPFWQALPLKFDMDSLTWFISPQGQAYLKIEYSKFCLDLKAPKKYDLADVKQGEDKKVQAKTKTIKDFINYGSKKENS